MNKPSGVSRPILVVGLVLTIVAGALLAACGSSTDSAPAANNGAAGTGLPSVDGRAVSATDAELVLRTIDGERRFQIKPEDLLAVTPSHFASHVGVETLGFRVYYSAEGGIDYAVSVEEIRGSTLGFD